MADPKIKIGITSDFDSKGIKDAQSGFGGFKQSIADADGVGGKFKAGFSSLKESVVQNAGALAAGAGVALVGFGIKALAAFQEVAEGAKELSAATGLAVEDASRWRSVADDFGVTGEAIGKTVGKVTKELDASKWKDFGIETRDAAGHARDMNDIMLDSFDALSKIQDPVERATAGTKLFGKAYADIAPMIGKTREEYEDMLGAVEKGQVVTKEELEKSEDMRVAQDHLSDAFNEVVIAIGGFVASAAPAIDVFASLITKATEFTASLEEAGNEWGKVLGDEKQATAKEAAEQLSLVGKSAAQMEEALKKAGLSTAEITDLMKSLGVTLDLDAEKAAETERETKRLGDTLGDTTEKAEGFAGGLDHATRNSDLARASLDLTNLTIERMLGEFDNEEAIVRFGDVMLFTTEKIRNGIALTNDDIRSILTAVQDVQKAHPGIDVSVALERIEQGDIEGAWWDIQSRIKKLGALTYESRISGPTIGIQARASGGPASGLTLVGEQGPELVNLPGGSHVTNATETAAMLNGNSGGNSGGNTFNVYTGADPQQVIQIIKRYVKNGGQL